MFFSYRVGLPMWQVAMQYLAANSMALAFGSRRLVSAGAMGSGRKSSGTRPADEWPCSLRWRSQSTQTAESRSKALLPPGVRGQQES
jgi:hypothetical protein